MLQKNEIVVTMAILQFEKTRRKSCKKVSSDKLALAKVQFVAFIEELRQLNTIRSFKIETMSCLMYRGFQRAHKSPSQLYWNGSTLDVIYHPVEFLIK